jgi:hypothetical protein
MVICTSARPGEIVDILGGARKGTKFSPLANSLKGRKRWLLTGVASGAPARARGLWSRGCVRRSQKSCPWPAHAPMRTALHPLRREP